MAGMRGYRGFEIVFGLLLASIFWAGVLWWQASRPTQHNNSEQKSEQSAVTRAELDNRLANYTLWLAIFTCVLAVSTIGLWIAAIFTLRHSRETAQRQLRAYLGPSDCVC